MNNSQVPYKGNEKFFDEMLSYINYFSGNPENEITFTPHGYPNYPKKVRQFMRLLGSNELTCYTDYKPQEASGFLEKIDSVGWYELRTIFTAFQRGERFCDGYIASLVKDKLILKALVRLQQLIEAQKA